MLWLPASLLAASVSGMVLDSQDLPVPRAHVSVVCSEGRADADTDATGRFTITPPAGERCVLTVTSEGFATTQIALQDPADAERASACSSAIRFRMS